MSNDSFEKLDNDLGNLTDSLEKMNGHNEIKLNEVLTTDFLSHYTKFNNVDDFFNETNITDEDISNYEKSPEKLDKIAQDYAKFESFDKMIAQATMEKQFIDNGFGLS